MTFKELERIIYNRLAIDYQECLMGRLYASAQAIAREIVYKNNGLEHAIEAFAPEPKVAAPARRFVVSASTTTDHQNRMVTTAVCADGTIWTKYHDGVWHILPAIPPVNVS